MTEQEIYLEQYDWTIRVCYNVNDKDCSIIRKSLLKLGCKGEPLDDACNLIMENKPNKGITYSNIDKHQTVVSVGFTIEESEFVNSISHEMLHAVQHIAEKFSLDLKGEDVCYLMGSLMQAVYLFYI